MLRATVDKLVEVTAGTLLTGDRESMIAGLAIDSREVVAPGVFVALSGERTDGHDHVLDALGSGARAVLVDRAPFDVRAAVEEAQRLGAAVIHVDDSLGALHKIAAWHRSRLRCAVVGLTGSSGKTTTKDFLKAAVGGTLRVAATQGNRNNEIGVPLTILDAGTECDVLVLEMGMRGLGQIAELCEIARPDFGLVTNVGVTHIELLGTQDMIAQAKGELVEAIEPKGTVFLNGDDAYSGVLAAKARSAVVLYGLGETCEITATQVVLDELSRPSFAMHTPQGDVQVTLTVPGRHNVYNALAAAAVALRLGVPLESIAEGLAAADMSAMRMETFVSASGVTVINDAYNANPTSMSAAVETLAAIESSGRRVAVLGDMAELGSLTELAHFHLGEEVARSGIDVLVTVGERARRIADGAKAAGMDPDAVRPCVTTQEAVEVLDDLLDCGDTVLEKASRSMGLEAVDEGVVTPRAH